MEHYGAAYHEATWRPLMGALEAVLVDEVGAGRDAVGGVGATAERQNGERTQSACGERGKVGEGGAAPELGRQTEAPV